MPKNPFWQGCFESREDFDQALQSGQFRLRKQIPLHPKQRLAIRLNDEQERPQRQASNHAANVAKTEYRVSDTQVLSMQQANDTGLLAWAQSQASNHAATKVLAAQRFNLRDHLATHPQAHKAAQTLLGFRLLGGFSQWLNGYGCFSVETLREAEAIERVRQQPPHLQEKIRKNLCMTPAQFSRWLVGDQESQESSEGVELPDDLEAYRAEFQDKWAARNPRGQYGCCPTSFSAHGVV